MFIIVTIRAEVFPVRSIRGIVVVISVFVMHREQMSRLDVELSGTLGADEPVNLQGLFPVGAVAGGGRFGAQFFENLINRFIDGRLLKPSQFGPTLVGISHAVYSSNRWLPVFSPSPVATNRLLMVRRLSKVSKNLSTAIPMKGLFHCFRYLVEPLRLCSGQARRHISPCSLMCVQAKIICATQDDTPTPGSGQGISALWP